MRQPQLEALLRDRIDTGRLVGRLPAERVLMRRYSVSRHAVRATLASLRAAGLVVTERGSGSYTTGTEPGLAGTTLPATCPRCGHAAAS